VVVNVFRLGSVEEYMSSGWFSCDDADLSPTFSVPLENPNEMQEYMSTSSLHISDGFIKSSFILK